MRTIGLFLCLVCTGCMTVSPPATIMQAPAPTRTLAVTTPPTPVNGRQERLLQAVGEEDDEACRRGMGD